MRFLRFTILCASTVFLASCTNTLPPLISWAHFSSPVSPSYQLNPTNAVIYGRFATGPDFSFGNALALRIRNETSKQEYLVELRDKDSVCGIQVKPGRYQVAGFVATFFDHRTVGRRNYPSTPAFEVRSNMLTYVGDFTGYAKLVGIAQEWAVRDATNNFAATTAEFKKKCPNLADAPTFSWFDAP